MGGVTRPAGLSQEEGALYIRSLVEGRQPFAVGKLGTSECNALLFFMLFRWGAWKSSYPQDMFEAMVVNAGLFPATEEAIDEWAGVMISYVLPRMDGVAQWNPGQPILEVNLLDLFAPTSKRFPLRSLEPYYESETSHMWTTAFPANSRVAVVSPFGVSITKQWDKRTQVWAGRTLWNTANPPTILPVVCHYTPEISTRHVWRESILEGGWKAAVLQCVDQAVEMGAQYAIVGCGALSLPIAVEMKLRGIGAIHLGGATQILFGIQGKRWMEHPVISTFMNLHWCKPESSEVPTYAERVEGGCYW